jgi:hypothetical protein
VFFIVTVTTLAIDFSLFYIIVYLLGIARRTRRAMAISRVLTPGEKFVLLGLLARLRSHVDGGVGFNFETAKKGLEALLPPGDPQPMPPIPGLAPTISYESLFGFVVVGLLSRPTARRGTYTGTEERIRHFIECHLDRRVLEAALRPLLNEEPGRLAFMLMRYGLNDDSGIMHRTKAARRLGTPEKALGSLDRLLFRKIRRVLIAELGQGTIAALPDRPCPLCS